MPTFFRRLAACVAAFVVSLSPMGCTDSIETPVRAITSSRMISDETAAPQWNASTAERFGFAGRAGSQASPSMGAASGSSSSGRAPLEFELPAGWTELAPTSMRVLNFAVAGSPDAECYLASLPGVAGGVLANVNRWRSQMGLGPLSPAEVDALPQHPLLGKDAWFVDLRGSFTGMSGATSDGERRLLGLLHVTSAGSLFLKAVGPVDVLNGEADAFLALAASLRTTAAEHDHAAHAGEPHDHASEAPASAPANSPLHWTVPAEWQAATDSSMSLAAFELKTEPTLRVTLSLLPGTAGGVRANLDRWAAQVGHSALDQAAFAALPRLSILGDEAPLLERAGPFAGMGAGAQGDAVLLGVVHPFGGQTIFVKLVGPREVGESQRAAFVEFCASLRASNGG